MSLPRLIARLDVKGTNVIKGIQLEGLRIVGDPKLLAQKYYEQGIDELIYMDVVASLYGRNTLANLVQYSTENIFVPITVGGGIRSLEDIQTLLNHGADRVAINTAAIKSPQLIQQAAKMFGAQCIVLSIEAKKHELTKGWQAFFDNGREPSGLDVVDWAKRGEELGAGEILLTSVDYEGTREGFDLDLVQSVANSVSIPVIASGGFNVPYDFVAAVKHGKANAIAIADAFHYNRFSINEVKQTAYSSGVDIRDTIS